MKKVSLFALLVLAGMLFIAPALKAQEAGQDSTAEKAKKVKALAALEDDDQLGNFLASLTPEELAAVYVAIVESGDQDLIDRVTGVLEGMGVDVGTLLGGGSEGSDDSDLLMRPDSTSTDPHILSRGADYGI